MNYDTAYAQPFVVAVMALGLKQPQRVYIKKQPAPHHKWTILIGERIFFLSRLEIHKFDNDWPLPFCNWPEIFSRCKEDIHMHTRSISKMRARETREKKKVPEIAAIRVASEESDAELESELEGLQP